ncbi:hypothetical protein LINGRAHAP2_LOCUS34759 [Linum grandiflorum]
MVRRSWHIHHSPMLLRRWFAGIAPISFTLDYRPIWLTLRRASPELLLVKGISWLASHFGTPINKMIRDGLDVKICSVLPLSWIRRSCLCALEVDCFILYRWFHTRLVAIARRRNGFPNPSPLLMFRRP